MRKQIPYGWRSNVGRAFCYTYLGSYEPWIFPRNAQLGWVFYKLGDNLTKALSEPVSK